MAEPLDVGAVVVTYRLDRDASSFAAYQAQMSQVITQAKAAERAANFTYGATQAKGKGGLTSFAKGLERAGKAAQQYGGVLSALNLQPKINSQAVATMKLNLRELKKEALETYAALKLVNEGLNPAPMRAAGRAASEAARRTRAHTKAIKEQSAAVRDLGDAEVARRRRIGLGAFGAEGLSTRGPAFADSGAGNIGRRIGANTPGLATFGVSQLQGTPTRELERQAARARAAQEALTKEITQTIRSTRDLGAMLDRTANGAPRATASPPAAQRPMRQAWSRAASWQADVFGPQLASFKKAYQEIEALDDGLRERVSRPIGPRVDSNGFAQLKRNFNEMQTFAFRFARDIQLPVRFAMRWMGTTAAAIGGPLAAAGVSAARFSDELTKIQVVAGATSAEIAKLRQQDLQLATEGRFSALELAQAQNELIKGGMTAADVYGGGLKTALALSTVAQIEMADAAVYTSNAMNLFGVKAKDSMSIANSLTAAANATTASVSDFGMALSQGGSAAKMVGMDMKSTTAILMALSKMGIKNSDAGTSFKSSIVQATGGLSPRARMIMDELGLSLFKANGQIKDAVELTQSLEEAMKGLSKEEQITALTQIFGSDGFRTAIAMLQTGTDGMRKFVKVQKEADTQAKQNKMNDTLMGQFERLGNTINSVAIQVFRPLEPKVKAFVKDLQASVKRLKGPLQLFARDVGNIVFGPGTWQEKWDKLWQRIVETGVPQTVVNALTGVIAKLISSAFKGLWEVFKKADPLGKTILIGLTMVKLAPAGAAIAGLLARLFGTAFGSSKVLGTISAGMSGAVAQGAASASVASAATGMAGGVVAGGRGGKFGARAAGMIGTAGRVGAKGGSAAIIGIGATMLAQQATDAAGMGAAGSILSSALGGAVAGAAFGPWGAAAGAAIGGLLQAGISTGLFKGLFGFVSSPDTKEVAESFGRQFGNGLEAGAKQALTSSVKAALDAQERYREDPTSENRARKRTAGVQAGRDISDVITQRNERDRRQGLFNVQSIISRTSAAMRAKNEDGTSAVTNFARREIVRNQLMYIAQWEKSGQLTKGSYDKAVARWMKWPELSGWLRSQGLVDQKVALTFARSENNLRGLETRLAKIKEQFRLTPEVVGLSAQNSVRVLDEMIRQLEQRISGLSGAAKARAVASKDYLEIQRADAARREARGKKKPGAATGAVISGSPGASMPIRVHSNEVVMNRDQIDMVGRERIMSVLSMTGAQSLRAGGSYAGGGAKKMSPRVAGSKKLQEGLHPGIDQAKAVEPTQAPGFDPFRRKRLDLEVALAKAEGTVQPDKAKGIKDTRADDKSVLKKMRAAYIKRISDLERMKTDSRYRSRTWQDLIKSELSRDINERNALRDRIMGIGGDNDEAAKAKEEEAQTELLPGEKAVEEEADAFIIRLGNTPGMTAGLKARMEREHDKNVMLSLLERRKNEVQAAWQKATGPLKQALQRRFVKASEDFTAMQLSVGTSGLDSSLTNSVAAFGQARSDLYREFGGNSRALPVGGTFAGYGSGLAGSGGAMRGGTMVTQNITIAEPPVNAHAFAQKLAWETRAAL